MIIKRWGKPQQNAKRQAAQKGAMDPRVRQDGDRYRKRLLFDEKGEGGGFSRRERFDRVGRLYTSNQRSRNSDPFEG